ncbi:MAG: hypothetical protein IJ685_03190 [Selenomonadaceae bacterium]|nr:hypothetical protein [Selenomonadaceae bacterium]
MKKSSLLKRYIEIRQFFNNNPWIADVIILAFGYFVGVFNGRYQDAMNILLTYLWCRVLFPSSGSKNMP